LNLLCKCSLKIEMKEYNGRYNDEGQKRSKTNEKFLEKLRGFGGGLDGHPLL